MDRKPDRVCVSREFRVVGRLGEASLGGKPRVRHSCAWSCQLHVPSWKATSPSGTIVRSGSPSSATLRAAPCSGCTAPPVPGGRSRWRRAPTQSTSTSGSSVLDRPGIGSSTFYQYPNVLAFADDLRTIADIARDRRDGRHRAVRRRPVRAGVRGGDARSRRRRRRARWRGSDRRRRGHRRRADGLRLEGGARATRSSGCPCGWRPSGWSG